MLILFAATISLKNIDNSTFSYIPKVENGVLDLSGWDAEENGIIPLHGEWEFYWHQLFKRKSDHDIQLSAMVKIPSPWNNYEINGEKLPGFGYATYRLKVVNCRPDILLSIYFPCASTAYNLFVDGKRIASNGQVAATKSYFRPQYKPQKASFMPEKSEFEIVFQVANFIYARGGIWHHASLGVPEKIEAMEDQESYKDLFLLGGLFMITLYYLNIFRVRRQERYNLYFILICLIFGLRIMMCGSLFIYKIVPDFPYRIMTILLYNSVCWIPVVFCFMIGELFPQKASLKIMKIFLVYAILATGITIILPIPIFTRLVNVFNFSAVLIVAYALYMTGKQAVEKKGEALLIMGGTIIVFMGAVYDVLYQRNMIVNNFGLISPLAYFIFALLMSFVLAQKYNDAFHEIEDLNERLTVIDQLKDQIRETELAFLQAQIKPHFLYNALSAIANVCYKDATAAGELIVDFAHYLRSSFTFDNLKQRVSFKQELVFIKSYVNIEKARFGSKIDVQYNISVDHDFMLPPLILQPIVENAIRHGISKKQAGGTVWVNVSETEADYIITVKDDGKGMEVKNLQLLLENANEGQGVGLYNIHHRLKMLYGTGISIESKKGVGTVVHITLPKGEKQK